MKSNERIKWYRLNILKISQAKFAKELDITSANYSNIETGRVNLTERVLKNICDVYNLNEEWIKNGKEPIKKTMSYKNELLSFVKEIDSTNNIKAQNFLIALSKLDMKDWDIIDKLIKYYLNAEKNNEILTTSSRPSKPDNELTVDEKRKLINEQLDKEEVYEKLLASTTTNSTNEKQA